MTKRMSLIEHERMVERKKFHEFLFNIQRSFIFFTSVVWDNFEALFKRTNVHLRRCTTIMLTEYFLPLKCLCMAQYKCACTISQMKLEIQQKDKTGAKSNLRKPMHERKRARARERERERD